MIPGARWEVAWPSSGQRGVRCMVQYATPTTDAMGGRAEPAWVSLGPWYAKVSVVPAVAAETIASLLYQAEGPYWEAMLTTFTTGKGLRLVANGMTLKVFQIENPQLKNRILVAYCGTAVNNQ